MHYLGTAYFESLAIFLFLRYKIRPLLNSNNCKNNRIKKIEIELSAALFE